MKLELIKKFMEAVGVHDPMPQGKWLMGHCPLAPWRHTKGKDSRPSFGVHTENGTFNCFTCESGTLESLLGTLELWVQEKPELAPKFHFDMAREILQGLENYLEPLPDYQEIVPEGDSFTEWPEYWLEQFIPVKESARAQWYFLEDRPNQGKGPAITESLWERFDLRYDPASDRIVCPFRNVNGRLAGARGRAIDCTSSVPHWDYTWNKVNNSHSVWYNEQALELAALYYKPVAVVEGQFDCINVSRVYPYVVAGLTAKSSREKTLKLQACDGVICMLDNDAAGDKAWERYKLILGNKVKLGRISYPTKDPAMLTEIQLNSIFEELLI